MIWWVSGLGVGEVLLMALLGRLFWRLPISHGWQAARYTLGTCGIWLAVLVWAALTEDWAALLAVTVFDAAAGAGALLMWGGMVGADAWRVGGLRSRLGRTPHDETQARGGGDHGGLSDAGGPRE